MQRGIFDQEIVVTPGMCDASGLLGYADVFELFQDIAAEHAEEIGVGAAAMTQRGIFWLVTQTKVSFSGRVPMMTRCRLSTWPVTSKSSDRRVFRCCRLSDGDQILCQGKTLWTILNTETGRLSTMGESGFPEVFPFAGEDCLTEPFLRFHETFLPEEAVYSLKVRASHTDFGGHVNNVSFVRILLDAFSARELSGLQPAKMEIRYAASCYEGEELTVYRRKLEEGWLLAVQRGDERPAAYLKITE